MFDVLLDQCKVAAATEKPKPAQRSTFSNERAMTILKLLHENGPTVTPIVVEKTGFNRTACGQILNTLVEKGYAEKQPKVKWKVTTHRVHPYAITKRGIKVINGEQSLEL